MKKLKNKILDIWYIPVYRRFLLYAFFGIFTVIANIGTFYVFRRLGLEGWQANVIAWIAAVLVAFYTNRRWVFKSESRNWVRQLIRFSGYRLVTGFFEEIVVIIFIDGMDTRQHFMSIASWDLLIKVLCNIFVITLNYIFSKKSVFKEHERLSRERMKDKKE